MAETICAAGGADAFARNFAGTAGGYKKYMDTLESETTPPPACAPQDARGFSKSILRERKCRPACP